jgi:hypothetical protein
VRRTEEQWSEILRRFHSSEEGIREFCRREGLALSSFQRWQQRLGSVPARRFVELVPAALARMENPRWSLEVSLPLGVTLRFQG